VKIYVIKRDDGTYWADTNERIVRRGKKVIVLDPVTRTDLERLVKGPNDYCDARISALAERELDAMVAATKVVIPAPNEKIYRGKPPIPKKTRWQRFLEVFRGG
jgi:hypothetical protein